MRIAIKKAFDWAHRGIEIEHFAEGQEIETEDADLIAVSVAEGWAILPGDDRTSKEQPARAAKPRKTESK